MATIINTPPSERSSDGVGVGLVMGILVAILLVILFFIYGLPMLQGGEVKQAEVQKIEIQLPTNPTTPPASTP